MVTFQKKMHTVSPSVYLYVLLSGKSFFEILGKMANSVDPDQTAPFQEQSDQGLYCLSKQ